LLKNLNRLSSHSVLAPLISRTMVYLISTCLGSNYPLLAYLAVSAVIGRDQTAEGRIL